MLSKTILPVWLRVTLVSLMSFFVVIQPAPSHTRPFENNQIITHTVVSSTKLVKSDNITTIPDDLEYITDVVCGKGGTRLLKVNILRLKKPPKDPMPVAVRIHGGAWLMGTKDEVRPVAVELAHRGYFNISIEYRLSQEAPFPAQIEDCKTAIRWLRANAQTYNIDPNRIGVWGGSSGGHLASLVGLTGDVKELEGNGGWQEFSSKVELVVNVFGHSDLLRMSEGLRMAKSNRVGSKAPESPTSPESRLIGGSLATNREKARRASPITYVKKGCPPFLILHGDRDPLVPINQSFILFNALKKVGGEVEMHIFRGQGHGFPEDTGNDLIINFFEKHFKKKVVGNRK